MTFKKEKQGKKLRGTLQKVIKSVGQPERVQINIDEDDDLYREISVSKRSLRLNPSWSPSSKSSGY